MMKPFRILLPAVAVLIFLALIMGSAQEVFGQTYLLTPDPKFTGLDENGNPIASGKLCTYAAGTSTPLVTYSNSSGAANANPVVLDASGRATVYLSSASYKFTLRSASATDCDTGTIIYTQDNISAGLPSSISGTANTVAKFNSTGNGVTDSNITDNGSLVSVGVPATITTSVTVATVIGGSAVGSTLDLKSTSGVGTTDMVRFLTGNNGATIPARVTQSGVEIGPGTGVLLSGDGDGAVTILGQGNGTDEDLTFNFDDTANTVSVTTSTGVTALELAAAIGVNLGPAGVRMIGDGDGAITWQGLGNGDDEDLTLNLDDTANTGVISSSTSLDLLQFSSINLEATGIFQNGDRADAGFIRLQNAANIAWEASPAGTDYTLGVNSSEILQASGPLAIPATSRYYLDGGGDTYITENSADSMQFVVGGSGYIATSAALYPQADNTVSLGRSGERWSQAHFASFIAVSATGLVYLDGGGDTYITESSANTYQLATNGTVRQQVGSTGIHIMSAYADGTASFTGGNGTLTTSSDARLKDIQEDFYVGSLKEILQINPIAYKWNDLASEKKGIGKSDRIYAGFSAQNVQSVLPHSVSQDEQGYLSLSERGIVAALVNAVKELNGRIEQLERRPN